RRALLDPDERQARLELVGAIAHELRPRGRAGYQRLQRREHLAAVADAERERVLAREKLAEHQPGALVVENRLRPALARAEHVAVREAAAHDQAGVVAEVPALREEIAHVHVVRLEARAGERRGHLALAV